MRLSNGIDIGPLLLAQTAFDDGLRQAQAPGAAEIVRDGAIQRFELTFELAWKTMKRLLRAKGSQANHSRDVIREAAAEGWIENPVPWFDFLEKRNLTSHAYDRRRANEIFAVLPDFQERLERFVSRIRGL